MRSPLLDRIRVFKPDFTFFQRYDGITASGPRSSYSNDTLYNDNKDYSVKSAWDMMVVKLNVDGSEVASIKDGFDQNNLNIDKVYVGGIKRSLGFYDMYVFIH